LCWILPSRHLTKKQGFFDFFEHKHQKKFNLEYDANNIWILQAYFGRGSLQFLQRPPKVSAPNQFGFGVILYCPIESGFEIWMAQVPKLAQPSVLRIGYFATKQHSSVQV
jgi:hypothetical protein